MGRWGAFRAGERAPWIVDAVAAGLATAALLAAAVLLMHLIPPLIAAYPFALLPLLFTGPLAVRRGVRSPARALAAGLLAGLIAGALASAALSFATEVLRSGQFSLRWAASFAPMPALPRPELLPWLSWPQHDVLLLEPALAGLAALATATLIERPHTGLAALLRRGLASLRLSLRQKLGLAFLSLSVLLLAVAWLGFSALEEMHFRAHAQQLRMDWAQHLQDLAELLGQTRALSDTALPAPARQEQLAAISAEQRATLDHLRTMPPHPAIAVSSNDLEAMARRYRPLVDALDSALQRHVAAASRLAAARAGPADQLRAAERDAERALQRLQRALLDETSQELDATDLAHHSNLILILALTALAMAVTLLISRALAEVITTPIEVVGGHLDRLARGDFSRRLRVTNHDELGRLAAHLNHVTAELERLYQVEREGRAVAEKLAERERELAASQEARYQALVEQLPLIVYTAVRDGANSILYVSPQVQATLGYSQEEWLADPALWSKRLHPEDRERVLAELGRCHARGEPFRAEYRLLDRDGRERWFRDEAAPVWDASRQAHVLQGVLLEITERKRMEATLEHQALHDALTGLPNRALLRDRLDQAVQAAKREGQALALLVMDLDRFKDVNDALGHPNGDLLLQQVGQRLRNALRASDTVARLGGDEFAALLPATGAQGAARTAEKLLQALERPFQVDDHHLEVGASVGIATYPHHGETFETLLRCADVAMYAAKRDGSGHALYSPEQDWHSRDRLALMGELRRAIEQDELLLYFQPKVDLRSGHLLGAEALVRWQHPQRGLIPPDQFIPLAEQTGLIKPLSHWALNAALRQCQAWHEQNLEIPVAVNLSMRNLHDPQLPHLVAELLETWCVPPSWLRLEITESAAMADPGRTLGTLRRLRAIGVSVAIDDFGTGYSSLSYLKQFPVQELKIDRSFVRDVARDENDQAIVRATVELGHALSLEVIAEGVEDESGWNQLAALGCDGAQGYYLARPLPAPDLIRLLVGPRPGLARNGQPRGGWPADAWPASTDAATAPRTRAR